VYDDLLTVGRLSGHDSQTSWVTRGLDFSLSRDGLGGIAGLLATSIAGEATHLITDGRGNIRFTADRPPTRIREFEYQPFGVAFGIGNEHKSFGFSSKEQFNDLQLVDFGRRFYLPSIGRWLARDPVEEADGINLYAFVRNDPINEVDPYGLACFKKRPLGPNTAPKWFEKWVAPWWNPSLGDYLDWATEHEHIFYEDGTDVGCFPEGPHPDRATNYESQDCGYNDCVLRKAVQAVPCRGYDLMFNNCQDWASDVRGKYQSLMNDCSVSTGCGVFCVPPAFRQGVPGWVPPM
ncbi:MAG: RHS repeat-associated core domain-containing protein, partial [Verrucomicrobiota bacterium]